MLILWNLALSFGDLVRFWSWLFLLYDILLRKSVLNILYQESRITNQAQIFENELETRVRGFLKKTIKKGKKLACLPLLLVIVIKCLPLLQQPLPLHKLPSFSLSVYQNLLNFPLEDLLMLLVMIYTGKPNTNSRIRPYF